MKPPPQPATTRHPRPLPLPPLRPALPVPTLDPALVVLTLRRGRR